MFGGVLMPSKKTGLFLNSISEPIVNEVMQKFGYTKISNAINFIIQEYSRLTKEDKQEVVEQKVEEKVQSDFSGWFVAEDKQG